MTALVTALGLLPLALGTGEPGREIEGPMATIIVGGLVTSTILNLLVLPTILLHFGKFERGSHAPRPRSMDRWSWPTLRRDAAQAPVLNCRAGGGSTRPAIDRKTTA